MAPPSRPERPRPLEGARILLVEDDMLIQMELEFVLRDAGAAVVGPCRSVAEALPLADAAALDAAILDFGLGAETAAPIAQHLAARAVPFLFYTGQVATDPRLAPWRGCKILPKPAAPRAIVAAMAGLLRPS